MLNDRVRVILFWFTIGMVMLVAAVAVITILRACGRSASMAPPLTISPAEISLCPGEQHQFTVEGDAEVTWHAAGGTISENGLFTAGDAPGDYIVTATQRGTRRAAEALVRVVACTPTPTPVPSPSPTPTSTPTAAPTPEPTPTPPADPQGDVGTYESGAPVEGVPAGVDIRAASVGTDLRVDLQTTAGAPAELAGWAAEGEVLLWIEFYEPLPTPPVYADWLFALDLDGNTATGRPAGSVRINPDLGDEAVVGVLYDPAGGEYAPYFLVWDAAQESWTDGPDVVRFQLDESRMVIGLAVPLGILTQSVAQATGVTLVPEAMRGRAAALSYAGEQAVIDFYPDRPD
jgi:hypothetical protein